MPNTLRAIAVDDSQEALDSLKILLKGNKQLELVACTTFPDEVAPLLHELKPDALLLDIQMPRKNGFQLLDELKHLPHKPAIIFTTAYDHYAIKAIRYAAFDYLLKPIDITELQETIDRLLTQGPKGQLPHIQQFMKDNPRLSFPSIEGLQVLAPKDIIYAEADGNYTVLQLTESDPIIVSSQIGILEEELTAHYFYRISRKHLINLNYLRMVNRRKKICELQIDSEQITLPVAARRLSALQETLKK